MTGCMISGWGNAARTGYGSKFEKLLMKGVVGYVDKATCNQKHGEGLSILFLWLHTFRGSFSRLGSMLLEKPTKMLR